METQPNFEIDQEAIGEEPKIKDFHNPIDFLAEFKLENQDKLNKLIEEKINSAIKNNPALQYEQDINKEISEIVWESTAVKQLLWDFYELNRLHASRDFLPQECYQAIIEYWRTIDDIRKLKSQSLDRNEIINLDMTRSAIHTHASQLLVTHNIAPNTTVARLLISFMSITAGYDKVDRERDERRINFFLP